MPSCAFGSADDAKFRYVVYRACLKGSVVNGWKPESAAFATDGCRRGMLSSPGADMRGGGGGGDVSGTPIEVEGPTLEFRICSRRSLSFCDINSKTERGWLGSGVSPSIDPR